MIYTHRFRRVPDPTPFRLTPRDEEILKHVWRHRFMRSDQIARLVKGSPQGLLRRLKLLFLHRYLDRPLAQRFLNHEGTNLPLVYSLGRAGARHLFELGLITSTRVHEKNVKHLYLEHTLLITEFMTRLEADLSDRVTLRYEEDISGIPGRRTSAAWRVPIVYQGVSLTVGVVPDRVFSLSTHDETVIFCLEVDRGTMPALRSSPFQTSYFRKILAYHETWKKKLHKSELGWSRFRVLTLTSSEARRDHLVRLCQDVTDRGGSGLFLFADQPTFQQSGTVPKMPWVLGSGLSPVFIVS